MGYSTIIISKFKINGEVTPELVSYINNFSKTRRMKRNNETIKEIYPDWQKHCFNENLGTDGEYFLYPVQPKYHFSTETENSDKSIIDFNEPPATQPSLWCDWKIVKEGEHYYIKWNGMEGSGNYNYWIDYIINHFLIPSGLSLSGVVLGIGEWEDDVVYTVCDENKLTFYSQNQGETTDALISKIKALYKNEDILSSCNEILPYADEINTLCLPDFNSENWWNLFEKISDL